MQSAVNALAFPVPDKAWSVALLRRRSDLVLLRTASGETTACVHVHSKAKRRRRMTLLYSHANAEDLGLALPFVEALAESRGGSNRLRALHLQKNAVADEVATDLAVPLAAAGVQELHLSTNRIGDAGGQALALACSHATSGLRKLTLLSNAIGDAAAASFGTILAGNPLLEQLNLSHNRIGDQGVAALVRGVQDNTRLRMLDVGVNKLCSRQAKAALEGAMAREALIGRQHRAFRSAAQLLLLAHLRDARGLENDPLCRLPEGVLALILDMAKPEGFPAIADRAVA